MVFNPTIPYNDLPLLPGDFNYNQVEILKSALKANERLAKLNGLSQLLPNAELLMAPLLVKESVASSAIENIHTTTQKVFQEEAIKEHRVN
jgi:Fic family protein